MLDAADARVDVIETLHARSSVGTGDPGIGGGGRLELTPKEFAVLQVLLEAQGRVVPPEELLERAWDEMADPFTNTVKMTISRLRAKLGNPPVITTIDQAGYRIEGGR